MTLTASHTASRRLVRLNEDLTISDIFSVRRSTREDNPDYPTTYHDPWDGEYELVCYNGKDIEVTGLDGRPIECDKEAILNSVPDLIKEWLRDVHTKKHSNFLPAGYGWDGKFSVAEYRKRQRANFLFLSRKGIDINIEKQWLEETLDGICMTPKAFLTLRWDDALDFPAGNLINFADGFIKRDVIFIYDNGDHELIKNKRIVGDTQKHPGIKIPTNVSRVIILTRGVTCDADGNQVGVGVTLLREY